MQLSFIQDSKVSFGCHWNIFWKTENNSPIREWILYWSFFIEILILLNKLTVLFLTYKTTAIFLKRNCHILALGFFRYRWNSSAHFSVTDYMCMIQSCLLNFALNTIQFCLFRKIVNQYFFLLKKVFFKRKHEQSYFEKNLLTYLALYVWHKMFLFLLKCLM